MRPLEIRNHKIELRARIKQRRMALDPAVKAEADRKISENVRRLYQYKRCDTLLAYVSTPIEVDTYTVIRNAWADGKRVAVPLCHPEDRTLTFHYITSFDQLSVGSYHLMEPSADSPAVSDYAGCMMIVSAFQLDLRGYRLGYGFGYYDRCMANFNGPSVGLCYADDVTYRMPNGRYDRPVDVLVTESWIRSKKTPKRKAWDAE